MIPTQFKGVTKTLGAPKGWNAERDGECLGLPIMLRDGACISRWMPDDKERVAISKGKAIFVYVYSGNIQPAISLQVEE